MWHPSTCTTSLGLFYFLLRNQKLHLPVALSKNIIVFDTVYNKRTEKMKCSCLKKDFCRGSLKINYVECSEIFLK